MKKEMVVFGDGVAVVRGNVCACVGGHNLQAVCEWQCDG